MQGDDVLSMMGEYFHILHLGEKSLDLGKILSTDTSIKILETVYNSDDKVGLSAPEISEALDIGRTTVIYHLDRMRESGLVKINPVLEQDANWKKFWDLYRKRSVDVSKEQFNRLHNARMNGVKLFVPTKKGFLVLPSTDVKAGQSMVREALASLTAPVMEREHKRMAKSASLLGTLGLLFIAFSFLLPGLPFFQSIGIAGAPAAAPMDKAPLLAKEFAVEAPPTTLAATTPPGKSLMAGEGGMEDSEEVAPTAEESAFESDERIANAMPKENVSVPVGQPVVQAEAGTGDRIASMSRIFSYAGTLLLGSVLGFLLYSYMRRR